MQKFDVTSRLKELLDQATDLRRKAILEDDHQQAKRHRQDLDGIYLSLTDYLQREIEKKG